MKKEKYNGKGIKIWLFMMKVGAKLGCHQKPERSFFFRGYQFPVCARCTGIYIGYLLAILLFKYLTIRFLTCIALNIPMLVDGLSQYKKYRESTQFLRLITGIMGGYGFLTFQIKLALLVFS